MQMSLKVVRVLFQILMIMAITYAGNVLQSVLHIPIAGSIVGLILFFLLLQFKIIPSQWVSKGSNFS